jgi:hypothetical protein
VLLAGADGPVLDLGGSVAPVAFTDWGSRRQFDATSLGRVLDPTRQLEDLVDEHGAGYFAAVLSVLVTPHVADIQRLFEAVAALLDDDARFLFVEPDAVAKRWAPAAGSGVRAVSGLELGRDITGAMWNSGLSVTRIDRRPVPLTVWPLRSLVSGVARLAPRDDVGSRRT